jgi:hypothetical protein
MRKHVTLRNLHRDLIVEEGIDATIERGLERLSYEAKAPAQLVSAIPVFRSDGEIFVTIIADCVDEKAVEP